MRSELKRLPVGIQTFEKVIEGGYIYVDKTDLIYRMAHDYNYAFLSRPRRFGKSLLCSTLASYFEGRKDLFEGLAIEKLETEWRQHPVLRFDLSVVKKGTAEDLFIMLDGQLGRYEEEYGVTSISQSVGERFRNLIEASVRVKGEKAVVIIDEYDAPVLNVLHDPERLQVIREGMRDFFAPLKYCDPYLRFTFLTGVTKFSQLSIFSELNNLAKISMTPRYSTICGITQEELETQLRPWVERLAVKLGITPDEALAELKKNYDGYHFASDLKDIYNPYSLLNAFDQEEMKDFWFDTGTPTSLINMLQKFGTNVADLDNGCEVEENEFNAPAEKMLTPMPFFYQGGYLTIKAYDSNFQTYQLKYPNREVRNGMIQALIPYYIEPNPISAKSEIIALYKAILSDNLDEGLRNLQAYLAGIPYAENASSEGHFQTMLYVVFSLLGRYAQTEVRTATGRIDIVLKNKTDIYVMELKIDRPAQEALDQIDQKGYLVPYTTDERRLHKVGIAFSTETRTLSEWKIATPRRATKEKEKMRPVPK